MITRLLVAAGMHLVHADPTAQQGREL